MSRLIDADKLIDKLKEYTRTNNCEFNGACRSIIEIVKQQPTAFNVQKVVDCWIFKNSPFELLNIAFERLFPNVKYNAYFDVNMKDEKGESVYGVTNFDENGEITIFIDSNLNMSNAVEIFAHELAHAGVGKEHHHDEVWEKAFDDLFNEYNKIGSEMFSRQVE